MAEPNIDDLYKSFQAADAAGDTKAAQALADYIRSLQIPAPSEKQIEMTTGAPLGVRAAVGSSTTMQDKLATLKQYFPDAQPYDKDNFIYTDPKTGRATLMNERNPVLFGVPLPTMGDIAGALPEISEFVGAGTGAARRPRQGGRQFRAQHAGTRLAGYFLLCRAVRAGRRAAARLPR